MDLQLRIQEILAEFDPELLVAGGCPADEYRSEARILAAQLTDRDSLEQIERTLLKLFHERFDVGYKIPQDENWSPATEIIKVVNPHKDRAPRLRSAAKEINSLFLRLK